MESLVEMEVVRQHYSVLLREYFSRMRERLTQKNRRVSLMAIGIGFNGNNTGRENILKSGDALGM